MMVGIDKIYSLRMKIYLNRRLGEKIGRKARLYGKIDEVNPHLGTIGDYSAIGRGSRLVARCPIRGLQPVTIGSFVQMGLGVVVLPGLAIGSYSIIGAASVVTRDIPPYSIADRNPAPTLRQRDPPEVSWTTQLLKGGKSVGKG